jgi:hypothetical protein
MATSGHPRPPDPDDLRRVASAEDDGDADREPPLPPRRWRPQSDALRQWRRRLDGHDPDRRL